MYVWILVFLLCSLKIETLFLNKRSKVTDYAALKWLSQESSIEIRAQKS